MMLNLAAAEVSDFADLNTAKTAITNAGSDDFKAAFPAVFPADVADMKANIVATAEGIISDATITVTYDETSVALVAGGEPASVILKLSKGTQEVTVTLDFTGQALPPSAAQQAEAAALVVANAIATAINADKATLVGDAFYEGSTGAYTTALKGKFDTVAAGVANANLYNISYTYGLVTVLGAASNYELTVNVELKTNAAVKAASSPAVTITTPQSPQAAIDAITAISKSAIEAEFPVYFDTEVWGDAEAVQAALTTIAQQLLADVTDTMTVAVGDPTGTWTGGQTVGATFTITHTASSTVDATPIVINNIVLPQTTENYINNVLEAVLVADDINAGIIAANNYYGAAWTATNAQEAAAAAAQDLVDAKLVEDGLEADDFVVTVADNSGTWTEGSTAGNGNFTITHYDETTNGGNVAVTVKMPVKEATISAEGAKLTKVAVEAAAGYPSVGAIGADDDDTVLAAFKAAAGAVTLSANYTVEAVNYVSGTYANEEEITVTFTVKHANGTTYTTGNVVLALPAAS
jgi:hypothetical protein